MDNRSFCYWLQGYFEITSVNSNIPATLNMEQLNIIKNKLEKVKENNELGSFTGWLDGALDILEYNESIEEEVISLIQTKLNDVFEHVIENAPVEPPVKTLKPLDSLPGHDIFGPTFRC